VSCIPDSSEFHCYLAQKWPDVAAQNLAIVCIDYWLNAVAPFPRNFVIANA